MVSDSEAKRLKAIETEAKRLKAIEIAARKLLADADDPARCNPPHYAFISKRKIADLRQAIELLDLFRRRKA